MSRTKRSLYTILSTSFPNLLIAIIGIFKIQVMLNSFGDVVSGFAFYVTSLSAYLMLFEGGIPTIFAYYLYEPFNKKNFENVSELINAIKIKYKRIFLLYLLVLMVLSLVAPLPFVDQIDYIMMVAIFLVMGLKTFSGLFMSRFNIMFTVDQKAYIPSIITNLEILLNLIVFIVLALSGVGLVYILIIDLFITIISKVVIYVIYKKNYHCYYVTDKVYPIEKMDTTPLYFHALTGVIVSQTDSIIITNFIGLAASTTFGLYNTVFSSLRQLVLPLVNVFNPGLASLYHESKQRFKEVFSTFIIWCFLVGISVSASLIISYEYFMQIWLAQNFTMVTYLAFALSVFLFTTIIISPINALNNLHGNYRETLKFTIIEAVLNVLLSLLLLMKFGILGVILATLITSLINISLRIHFVFERFYETLKIKYMQLSIIALVVFAANFAVLQTMPHYISFVNWLFVTLLSFIVNFVVLVLVLRLFYKKETNLIISKLFGKLITRVSKFK